MKIVHLKNKHNCEIKDGICQIPSLNLKCWHCKSDIHLHLEDLSEIPEGKIICFVCPFCNEINYLVKPKLLAV